MQEINEILKKIEQKTEQKIEELKKEINQKKLELEQKFNTIIEQEKSLIKENYEKEKELIKKRIYANNLIEYNKKIEEIKNKLITEIIENLKQKILALNKTLHYTFIKNILLNNLFVNEHNTVFLGKLNNLEEKEKNKLLSEINQQIAKVYAQTKIEFSNQEADFDFGVKIISGKKSKQFLLQTFIDYIKPFAEEEINKLISKENL